MSNPEEGPLMLAATDVLKAPPMRIAKVAGNFVLPRSVQVRSLVAGGVGGLGGLLIGVLLIGIFGLQGMLFSGVVGAAVAVMALQWQPQPGENLFQIVWVRLRASARQQKVNVGDRNVPLYIGVARLGRTAAGPVELRSGAITVRPGSVDERGAVRSEKNKNLDMASHLAGYPGNLERNSRLHLPNFEDPAPATEPPLPPAAEALDAWGQSSVGNRRLHLPDDEYHEPDQGNPNQGAHSRLAAQHTVLDLPEGLTDQERDASQQRNRDHYPATAEGPQPSGPRHAPADPKLGSSNDTDPNGPIRQRRSRLTLPD